MASLRSLAISILRLDGHTNIAAANRHHARDPQRTIKLLRVPLENTIVQVACRSSVVRRRACIR
jgi:hypothetical protein